MTITDIMETRSIIGSLGANQMAAKHEPQPVSRQCMAKLCQLQERILKIKERALEKLEPVAMPDSPRPAACEEKIAEAWPPYFAEMRDVIRMTHSYLDVIEGLLDRVEL